MNDKIGFLNDLAKKNKIKTDLSSEEDKLLENDKDLVQFLAETALVKKYTGEIQGSLTRMENIKEELVTAVGGKEKSLSSEIENIMEVVLQNQQKSNAVLTILNDKVTQAKDDDPEGADSNTRVKINLYGSYSKLFSETISKFEDVQSDIKVKIQGKVLRDAQIVLGKEDLDQAEKEKILADKGYVQKLLENKLTGAGHIKLQNAVSDLEERFQDIAKLENAVNQVHKLFLEMAALVQLQGEMVDNIELNIKTAKNHVLKAEKDILQAKKNIQSARKKKCCILIIVIVILLVIIMPILGVKVFSA